MAWEGDLPASVDALVSPETGLATIFANIAAGDRCIAVGTSAQAKASATRTSTAILPSYPTLVRPNHQRFRGRAERGRQRG